MTQFVNSGFPFWMAALADFLVLFLLCDAGFSGDWVRIGAITVAQEAFARKAAIFVAVAHTGTGAAAVLVGKERGVKLPAWRLFLEGWAFGAVGLLRSRYVKIY